MSENTVQKPEEEKKTPWVPRVITGGKDSDSWDGNGNPDWLRDLPVGSFFFVQDTQVTSTRDDKYPVLGGPFAKAYVSPNGRGVTLMIETPNGGRSMMPVDSLRFSNRYKLFDILHFGDNNPIQEEAPEGDEEDGSEGSVQS